MLKDEFYQRSARFFAGDCAAAAAYAKENCAAELSEVLGIADDAAGHVFHLDGRWDLEQSERRVRFPKEIDWLHQPDGDPEWVYAFNRMRFWICLGHAFAATGDEKYARAFADQLCRWVSTVKRDDPKSKKAWRSLEAGFRLEYWFKAVCCFRDSAAVDDEVLKVFFRSVSEQAEYLMETYDSYHIMSNWGIIENHGLFLAGVMLPPTQRTAAYRAEALRRLSQEVSFQVYPDGMHWEQSPMYHNEVLHCLLDVLLLSDQNGIAVPENLRETARAMCYACLYSQKPDGNMISMGDSDEMSFRPTLTRGAYQFHDGVLKSGACQVLDYDSVWDLGAAAAEEYAAILPQTPPETAKAFFDSGNFYFRSGWGADDVFLHFHCGTMGAGHGHADQLHVDLFSRGEDILLDAGRYTYVDGPERRELKSPCAHNTCTVNGKDFTVYRDSWSCSKLCRPVNRVFRTAGPYGYAEGGHVGYCDEEGGGVYVNRRVIYIKPDLAVLADEFYGSGPFTCQQYFHFNNRGFVSGSGRRYFYESDKNTAELCLLGGELDSSLIRTRRSPHYNHLEQNTALKTNVAARGFVCVFTVVSLSPAGSREHLEAKKLPVYSNFHKTQFDDSAIEALELSKGDKSYVVAVAHREYASPTDTFLAGDCTGFGNVAVFDRSKGENLLGTVLLW